MQSSLNLFYHACHKGRFISRTYYVILIDVAS